MSSIRNYWDERDTREKALITIMLALSIVIGFWFLTIAPVINSHAQAKTELQNAERDYITVARTLPKLGQNPNQPQATFNQGVFIAAAQRRGINPSRIQPGANNNLTVWIETQDTEALYGLLNDVITRHGALLSRASIATNANQTLSAQFTFIMTP